MLTNMNVKPATATSFLPDFCRLPGVFLVVIICELIAIILTLSPLHPADDRWHNLSLISLFTQWLGLSSAALVCLLRKPLELRTAAQAGVILYLLLMLNTLLFGEAGYQMLVLLELSPYGAYVDHAGFLLRSLGMSAIIHAFTLRYFYIQAQWRRNVRAEAEARLQVLQARIRPHFLFNTMNTIACLIRDQPVQAEQAIEDLAELMRVSLNEQKMLHPFKDELSLCRHYMDIEQLRLGGRLQVEWDITGQVESVEIPPLSLQPLVENAVYHGIEPLETGGKIIIRACRNGHWLELSVSNPLPPSGQVSPTGHQVAQDNIRQRLQLAYAGQASFIVKQTAEDYCAMLRIPMPR